MPGSARPEVILAWVPVEDHFFYDGKRGRYWEPPFDTPPPDPADSTMTLARRTGLHEPHSDDEVSVMRWGQLDDREAEVPRVRARGVLRTIVRVLCCF